MRRRRPRPLPAAPVFVVVALALLASALPATAAGDGDCGPWWQFEAVDLEGGRWDAEALAGKVVLLDFWATWCLPCLAELPNLRRAWERHRDQGFELLGVLLDRGTRRQARAELRRHRADWPQLFDGRGFAGPLAVRFGVDATPRNLLLDRAGRVVAVDVRGEALLAALPALLEQPAPDRIAGGTRRCDGDRGGR